MPLISDISWISRGMDPGPLTSLAKTKFATLLTKGAPVTLEKGNPSPNSVESQRPLTGAAGNQLSATQLQDLASFADSNGDIIVPSEFSYIKLGGGHVLSFDEDTLAGRITPALSSETLNDYSNLFGQDRYSFTGSDIRVMIEVPTVTSSDARPRYAKQLVECTTLSVSVHRERAPVRSAGYANPTGFANGKRTIAGTIILTQFTTEVLMRFLQSLLVQDKTKDTYYTKVDQLPMFNLTMFFSNEHGYASFRRLLGVKFVTDGTTYSIQDMMTEQSISYMALDFTPLLPLTLSSLYQPQDLLDRSTRRERSVSDLMIAI